MSDSNDQNGCPVLHSATALGSRSNQDWWPNQLNLGVLRQHIPISDLVERDTNYREDLKSLDVDQLRRDLAEVMVTSQDWWPADYGHYGPLFIRMAWHSAGTYRISDGRGGASRGAQRLAPLNSWPDNANLDKARRLLWPIKQKYGRKVSWADLIVFAGNVALESMGFETFGFAFGRMDIWEPEQGTYWGPEDTWLGDERYSGDRQLANPFGAVQMGLIYVNPEGPNGNPDPLAAAIDVRETFARMGMNDEETVALIAGGHTFGKTHGAAPDATRYIGPEPEGASLQEQGFGWKNLFGTGKGSDAWTSGLEGAWTKDPIKWDNGFFDNLFNYEWELSKSPGGANQWIPTDPSSINTVPDAHDPTKRHAPVLLTTDIALRVDPIYEPISRHFYNNPDQFADAFARAWYKLIHRDMGPITRSFGPLVPSEPQIWQDPVPSTEGEPIGANEIEALKRQLLNSGLSLAQLVKTAWASAATFRGTDRRGGPNGARIRLAPQKDWEVNEPAELDSILKVISRVQTEFNDSHTGQSEVSIADLIVLGGCAAIERAAALAGYPVTVPFLPGRTDASPSQTDQASFAVLEPTFDGFRNYFSSDNKLPPEHLLVERADLLSLTASEMTVLVGGLRVLGANYAGSPRGVFTNSTGVLTNDFFVNLLDMQTKWETANSSDDSFDGIDRTTGEPRWTASSVDLVFGSNSQLRAIAEVYACDDSKERFVHDFVAAWDKVMNLDRFDLA